MGLITKQKTIIIEYLSILRYSPRGDKPIDQKSRQVKDSIKGWTISGFSSSLAEIMSQNKGIGDFLGNSTLVPIPSSNLVKSDSLRVPLEICDELKKVETHLQICDCLERYLPVKQAKLGFTSDNRPSLEEHLKSIKFIDNLIYTDSIVLVDDVLTTGTIAAACARILNNVYPNKQIRVFALLRTVTEIPDKAKNIRHIETGTITLYPSNKTYIKVNQ
ncbi:hypothetical protein [Runella zeae]|uniref:hypothetical protein n=1 Tax=Runella zeae TaxID=94255 RepID=UPI002356C7D6|nr:hypothetical protein [Runella zeae]